MAKTAARSVASARRAKKKNTGARAMPARAEGSRHAHGLYPKAATPVAISSLAVGGWTHSTGASPARYCRALFAW